MKWQDIKASRQAKYLAHTQGITYQDFLDFYKQKDWTFEKFKRVQVSNSKHNFSLAQNFIDIFPNLTTLIQQANVCEVTCDDQEFRLFSWNCKDGLTRGWLNKIETLEDNESISKRFIAEHILLLNEIGGIQECSEHPNDSFSENQNFLFVGSECRQAMIYVLDEYLDDCKNEGLQAIDFENWICFVEEANGNEIMYDPHTKAVLMFAGDHCFDYVTPVANQPSDEYIYHIHGVKTFVDFVETFALQWLKIIGKPN